MTAVLYLPTWQRLPLYPETHWQSKSFPALTHVPPFLHGLGSHIESVKEIKETLEYSFDESCYIRNLEEKIHIFGFLIPSFNTI